MSNRLATETSPYLLQHAENPVDWYAWGDEAFNKARTEDKPVLLSVGYSACHWCHVMAHESFENAAVAALMNELFINIKVDREERPDVDTIYMQAVQGMTGHGGWPMTVFLTPDAVPFYGGTYFPPDDAMGMPAFPRVLRAAADAYRMRRTEIEEAGVRMLQALQPPSLPEGEAPAVAELDVAVRTLVQQTDRRYGGFGDAPKFPHPTALDLMLRRYRIGRDQTVWDAALTTLHAMARGGIFDQVGGGFHRYSIDARWAVPHFEKMLYDNAQLAPAYLHAYQLGAGDEMRDVCTRTLDYVMREMELPSGGFAASQDADSPEGEGSFFVWTRSQLRDALGEEDAALAARVFGVVDGGNFEHGTTVLSLPFALPRVAESLHAPIDELRQRLHRINARLYEVRASRPAPGRDDKVITAWNALTLKAFAEAGPALHRDDYVETARRAADFLLDAVVIDGTVLRTWKDGHAHITAFIEDVGHLSDALLTLYEATGSSRYFVAARDLATVIIDDYRSGDGTYYDTASTADPLIARPRSIDDNPVAAGQSAAATAFLRLFAFSGDSAWHEHAMEIIRPLAAAVARAPLALGSLAAAAEFAVSPVHEIAIVGSASSADMRPLADVVWERFDPLRVLAWGPDGDVPLLQGRTPIDGKATAYVCRGFVCNTPVTDAVALRKQLDAPRS